MGLSIWSAAAVLISGAAATAPAPTRLLDLDLTRAFQTRSPWRFTADQGSPVADPIGEEDSVPGPVRLCLRHAGSPICDPTLSNDMRKSGPRDDFSDAHALLDAKVVHPRGPTGGALLIVKTGSVRSGDGDQLVLVQALAYRRDQDRFERVYRLATGRNNNQDIRYVDAGPLRGDIISVEPTENAPFGFWVRVDALTPAYTYRQVLRYRSATHYNDGDALAVIDSEMPNIQRRLGVWRPGMPLPLPVKRCPKPHLIAMQLWCD